MTQNQHVHRSWLLSSSISCEQVTGIVPHRNNTEKRMFKHILKPPWVLPPFPLTGVRMYSLPSPLVPLLPISLPLLSLAYIY